MPSGRRLSIITAFGLSSPCLAETSHTSVEWPWQQRGEVERQEHKGPASMGFGHHQVLVHLQFGCWAEWESISRRYRCGLHSARRTRVSETFGVPKVGSPSSHGEGRSSHGALASCHRNDSHKSASKTLSATHGANPVLAFLVIAPA